MEEVVGSIIVQEPHIRFDGQVPMKILLQLMTTLLPDGDWSTYMFYYDLRVNSNPSGEYTKLSMYHTVQIGYKDNGEWVELGAEKKLNQRPWYNTPGNRVHIWVKIYKI